MPPCHGLLGLVYLIELVSRCTLEWRIKKVRATWWPSSFVTLLIVIMCHYNDSRIIAKLEFCQLNSGELPHLNALICFRTSIAALLRTWFAGLYWQLHIAGISNAYFSISPYAKDRSIQIKKGSAQADPFSFKLFRTYSFASIQSFIRLKSSILDNLA